MVSDDELSIYFGVSKGPLFDGVSTYRAQRMSKADKFKDPTPVTEINQGRTHVHPSWLSPDRCRLYIGEQGGGTNKILRATRTL